MQFHVNQSAVIQLDTVASWGGGGGGGPPRV